MAYLVPPYLNKFIEKCEKEYAIAEKKELEAKKNLEFATEYKELCLKRLNEAKK